MELTLQEASVIKDKRLQLLEVGTIINNITFSLRSLGPYRHDVEPNAVNPHISILPAGCIVLFEHTAAVVHLRRQGRAVSRHDVRRLLTHGVTVGRVQSE